MATIDIPLGEADDIVTTLVDNITQRHHPSNVKQIALQTIGYICESMVCGCRSDLMSRYLIAMNCSNQNYYRRIRKMHF